MKKILFITLMSIMLCFIVACENLNAETEERSRFVRIGEYRDFIVIMYDRDTKVQYAMSYDRYNRGTITVLVDAEGKPLLYEE